MSLTDTPLRQLKAISLFDGLPEAQLVTLAEATREKCYAKDEIVPIHIWRPRCRPHDSCMSKLAHCSTSSVVRPTSPGACCRNFRSAFIEVSKNCVKVLDRKRLEALFG
ncbi:MAG: hypothetical protein Q8L56_07815 [Rhodocyclaceae bacterium]|nr:hypothetical protein [Rhodocyclaceae bacterium]